MNEKRQPPTIITAVSSTVMGIGALAGCFFMVQSDGPAFLVITFILLNVGLIALAVRFGPPSSSRPKGRMSSC